jgi:hypothetical protein
MVDRYVDSFLGDAKDVPRERLEEARRADPPGGRAGREAHSRPRQDRGGPGASRRRKTTSTRGWRRSRRRTTRRRRRSTRACRSRAASSRSSATSPRRKCSISSWSSRDHRDQMTIYPPVRHRADQPRRAQLRHLQSAAHGPHRVPGQRASTTTWPTSSSRSSSSSTPRTRSATSSCTSTPRWPACTRGSPSTTPCSTCGAGATFCVGMAPSMGAVLLAAGSKGKRNALPNSRIMIHQPSGGSQGTAADIEIAAREILTSASG